MKIRVAKSLILINFWFACLICVPIFPFPLTFHFYYLFYFPSQLSCVWILLLLPSTVTSGWIFFSAMRFFLMFINAVCGLFLTIKLFKSGKCFSSQLNFISHYIKNVILRMNISRELKKCQQLSLFEGGGGRGGLS